MSELLEKAINELRSLPESEQDVVGQLLLDELSWEFDSLHDKTKLNRLASEALEEYRSGKTKNLNE